MSEKPAYSSTHRLESEPTAGSELVSQLRSTLERANELVRVLEKNIADAPEIPEGTSDNERAQELEKRLAATEADVQQLASQLVKSEHQAGRLMNLYVATYQLHATLDPSDVQATIAEIAVNLLGAKQFVLMLRSDDKDDYEFALKHGMESHTNHLFAGASYIGGDPVIDGTLTDGVLRFGPSAESKALAVVPLRVQGEIAGALVIFKLLSHKPDLGEEDRELLDLLSAHAASALFAARVFATKDRKLRTLESLIKLARGE